MTRTRASKKGDASSAAESAAATSPTAKLRRSSRFNTNNETPSPKQGNQRINPKEATVSKKKARTTKKKERELEMRQVSVDAVIVLDVVIGLPCVMYAIKSSYVCCYVCCYVCY
jgi:beta-glucanase (GH16 family)